MTVIITKPPSGSELKGEVAVEATYNGQRFNVATCTVDGKQLGSDSMQPISFSVDTTKVTDGARTLTVAVRYKTPAGKMRWQKAAIPIKVANALPNQWAKVADEYENFALTATAEVRYGTGTAWNSKVLGPGSYQCGNPLFGDPLPGANKQCEKRSTTGPPPPPPPPPPPTGQWEGPITITSGQTIQNRSFESNGGGTNAAVLINTSQPVTLLNCRIRNLAGGTLIHAQGYQLNDLTMENCFLYGGAGRVLDVENVDRLIVRNCTFDKTSGMKITESTPTQVLLTRNRHTNIQYAALSQFSQIGVVNGNVEISWNEIINEPELSHVEDILSIYASSGIYVHNNFFQGQWAPGNSGDTSQNGITIEQPGSNNNRIENNQLAGCMGGIGIFDGDNNQVLNNRVVRSGLYPDGTTRVVAGFSGIGVSPGQFSNNHLHGNLVGYVSGTKHGFGRTDWADDSMPAHCLPQNTHFPGTVTLASERAEWDHWVAKRSANGVTVGAS